MKRIAARIVLFAGLLLATPSHAQTFVVASCPSGTLDGAAGQRGRPFAIDLNGNLCVTGTIAVGPSDAAAAGVAPVNNTVAANGLVLKATPGNLYSLAVKIGATSGNVILIDAAAIPSNGAVTYKWCKPVLSNGTTGGDDFAPWNPPLAFATGIVALFSTDASCAVFTGSATAQFSGQPK